MCTIHREEDVRQECKDRDKIFPRGPQTSLLPYRFGKEATSVYLDGVKARRDNTDDGAG